LNGLSVRFDGFDGGGGDVVQMDVDVLLPDDYPVGDGFHNLPFLLQR